MRSCLPILVFVVLASVSSAVADQTPVPELLKRADASPVGDRPAQYIEIAERQLKAADELFNAGKVEQAQSAVRDVVSCSEKAHDAAVESGKRLKQTEIAERKMSAKLRDLKRTLNFDDQAPVQAASERLQSLADDLLSHMFGKGK
jgi:polyhydroxyalkanoate synthesis regulator phasin